MGWPIAPKQDDPQRLIALNGVPIKFWLSAEEINEIIKRLSALLGEETSLFKGEFDYMEELEAEHPLPEPGSTAHLRVVNGDDIFCRWDNTDKKWIQDGLVKDQEPVNIAVAENIRAVLEATGTKYYGTKDGVPGVWAFPEGTGGGSEPVETANGFKIYTFTNGYQGGLSYRPYADFEFEGTRYTVNSNFTLDTSGIPAGEKQQAAIVLNSNGTVSLVYGPASVNPPDPDIDPLTQYNAAQILLSSGAAAPEGVSLQKIYTNNSGIAGGEWDAVISRGGARWNLASNEGEDAVCIKGTNLLADDVIQLNAPEPIPVANFTEVTFKIKNLVDTGAEDSKSGFVFVVNGNYLHSNGQVRTNSVVLPSLDTGGYDVSNTQDWQYISLKMPAFSFISINYLRFIFDHGDPAVVPTILLDDIKYNDGSAPSGENFATVGFVERVIAELRAYIDQQDAAMLQAAKDYADSLAIGGADHLHDSYNTVPDMIADQNNQIDGEYFIAIDASDDPTVDAGWALYEYLGTTLGTIDDYRKLSEEESLDIIQYNYAQDIADVQAEVDALELRVTSIEQTGGGISIPDPLILTQSHVLTAANNNQLISVEDYASVVVPSGLGLKYRVTISKDTLKTVSLTAGHNVVLKPGKNELLQILGDGDGVTLAPKKIDQGIEHWGVFGALVQSEWRLPLGLSVEQTSAAGSFIYPIIYKSSEWPMFTFTKDYWMVYSSDHESLANGACYVGECDDPEGSGFVELGVLVSGNQAETPQFVQKDGVAYLFYHTDSEPGHTIAQETRLKSTTGGNAPHLCTYTDHGRPFTPQPGDNHTGYPNIFRRDDGTWVAHHLTQGEPNNYFGISTSTDLINWTRVTSNQDQTQGCPAGYTMGWRTRIYPFKDGATWYAVWHCFPIGGGLGQLLVSEVDNNFIPINQPLKTLETDMRQPYDGAAYIKDGVMYIFVYLDNEAGEKDISKAFVHKINLIGLV